MEFEGELSGGWFRINEMVVNSYTLHAINRNRKAQATHKLIIDNKEIKTTNHSDYEQTQYNY